MLGVAGSREGCRSLLCEVVLRTSLANWTGPGTFALVAISPSSLGRDLWKCPIVPSGRVGNGQRPHNPAVPVQSPARHRRGQQGVVRGEIKESGFNFCREPDCFCG